MLLLTTVHVLKAFVLDFVATKVAVMMVIKKIKGRLHFRAWTIIGSL